MKRFLFVLALIGLAAFSGASAHAQQATMQRNTAPNVQMFNKATPQQREALGSCMQSCAERCESVGKSLNCGPTKTEAEGQQCTRPYTQCLAQCKTSCKQQVLGANAPKR